MMYSYKGYNLPKSVMDIMEDVKTFKVREDDTWVVSFPKSGTTWTREIIYMVQTGLDFEGARANIQDRFPTLESVYPGLKAIVSNPSPRLISSHFPLSLLPENINKKRPKIVYIARNPKDVLVSTYHYAEKFLKRGYPSIVQSIGSFQEYCQDFIRTQGHFRGPWCEHVQEAWNARNDDNILFILYEDLKTDLKGNIKKIASFLGKALSSVEIEAIADHCSFDEMKNNDYVNYSWYRQWNMANNEANFIRKGKVGDWQNHLSKDIADKLDEWVTTKLEPLGLVFKDKLDDIECQ